MREARVEILIPTTEEGGWEKATVLSGPEEVEAMFELAARSHLTALGEFAIKLRDGGTLAIDGEGKIRENAWYLKEALDGLELVGQWGRAERALELRERGCTCPFPLDEGYVNDACPLHGSEEMR